MNESQINASFPGPAELRNEHVRAIVLLAVLIILFALVVIQGAVSAAYGGEGAWLLALLVGGMAIYEAMWLQFIRNALGTRKAIPEKIWQAVIVIEAIFPAIALAWAARSPNVDTPQGAASPVAWIYLLLIIVSTLRLDAGISRLCGVCAAIGYAAAGLHVWLSDPHPFSRAGISSAGSSFSYTVFLLVSGYAAGAVANQMRLRLAAAAQAAEAQTRAAQRERELALARSIQERIIPQLNPDVKGYDIAGWNHPVEETGADCFDWLDLGDGRIAFTIADVTGRGLESALAMASFHAWARAYIATGAELDSILPQLNRLLCEDLSSGKFITLAAGLLDPIDAEIYLISAGQGPLILYLSEERRFRRYDAQGLPLGLMPQATYAAPHYIELSPGDILVLATDGFTEWPNARGQVFGQDRMRTVIQANRNQPAAKIISELHAAVVEFAGKIPQPDDLTALIIKKL